MDVVDKREKYETPAVLIEFVVENTSVFHVRAEFIELFKMIQKADTTASLAQLDGDRAWGTVEEVPKGKEFLTIFKVRQTEGRTNNK
eukprot:4296098-Ditylum_brightwellii.AAC.1